MKINEQWSIESGHECFVVVETRTGINRKTGKPTVSESRTYHPTLDSCARKIIKNETLSACDEERLEDAVARVEATAVRFVDFVKVAA